MRAASVHSSLSLLAELSAAGEPPCRAQLVASRAVIIQLFSKLCQNPPEFMRDSKESSRRSRGRPQPEEGNQWPQKNAKNVRENAICWEGGNAAGVEATRSTGA
jgi:hypothetical protein